MRGRGRPIYQRRGEAIVEGGEASGRGRTRLGGGGGGMEETGEGSGRLGYARPMVSFDFAGGAERGGMRAAGRRER